jgi:hypothetical protein
MVLRKNVKRVQWKLFGMGVCLCFPRGFPSAFCCQVRAGLYFKNVTKRGEHGIVTSIKTRVILTR